ncbi:hypothetical protein [Desulfotalea psychrophila]|uniref:Uncharacterized protein n=1 Tax=Desulfotalea psychrophila (strain LSv54 / DSM 12343) TaxID=177439 RepID=Q6AIE8_DESPS|nr:hypothetical protein [Desulfotalea psychrophila]CAG37899.1 hypothetical protein DPPB35 [Desulfotalea psychrophila LSv54]
MTQGEIVFHIFELLGILGIIFVFFLKSYSSEKGKNLATKEDIGEITHQVENVRTQYLQKLEEISHQNKAILEQAGWRQQLRMAALEKRLKAHQEAYALWRNLILHVWNKEKIDAVVMECQEWWGNNCLYLEPEARNAFCTAYMSAGNHRAISESKDATLTKQNWKEITNAGVTLVECVKLPTISGLETDVPLPEEKENA